MTVLSFFNMLFPDFALRTAEVEAFRSMQLNTNCGSDCRIALSAARALYDAEVRAHGDSSDDATKTVTAAADDRYYRATGRSRDGQ